jgi:tetratricopeptide (TPR) repeat protein
MTDADLRDQLMAAYHAGDRQAFVELCHRHIETITRHFASWAVAPVEIRDDLRAVGDYVQALAAIAAVLDALGRPEPMDRLNPAGPANPLNRWKYAYQRAQQLCEAGEYTASTAELHTLLNEIHGTAGPGADEIRTKVAGLLGSNALRLGRIDEAIRHTEEALRNSQADDGCW